MITIEILEDDDVILETDFCRPLYRSADFSSHSDAWMGTNCYSGTPFDHLKWAHVYNVLGTCWYGKRLREFRRDSESKMEFVRGNIPAKHILNGKYPDLREFREV